MDSIVYFTNKAKCIVNAANCNQIFNLWMYLHLEKYKSTMKETYVISMDINHALLA